MKLTKSGSRKYGSGRVKSDGMQQFDKMTNKEIGKLLAKYKLEEIAIFYNIHLSGISKYLTDREIFKPKLILNKKKNIDEMDLFCEDAWMGSSEREQIKNNPTIKNKEYEQLVATILNQ